MATEAARGLGGGRWRPGLVVGAGTPHGGAGLRLLRRTAAGARAAARGLDHGVWPPHRGLDCACRPAAARGLDHGGWPPHGGLDCACRPAAARGAGLRLPPGRCTGAGPRGLAAARGAGLRLPPGRRTGAGLSLLYCISIFACLYVCMGKAPKGRGARGAVWRRKRHGTWAAAGGGPDWWWAPGRRTGELDCACRPAAARGAGLRLPPGRRTGGLTLSAALPQIGGWTSPAAMPPHGGWTAPVEMNICLF